MLSFYYRYKELFVKKLPTVFFFVFWYWMKGFALHRQVHKTQYRDRRFCYHSKPKINSQQYNTCCLKYRSGHTHGRIVQNQRGQRLRDVSQACACLKHCTKPQKINYFLSRHEIGGQFLSLKPHARCICFLSCLLLYFSSRGRTYKVFSSYTGYQQIERR